MVKEKKIRLYGWGQGPNFFFLSNDLIWFSSLLWSISSRTFLDRTFFKFQFRISLHCFLLIFFYFYKFFNAFPSPHRRKTMKFFFLISCCSRLLYSGFESNQIDRSSGKFYWAIELNKCIYPIELSIIALIIFYWKYYSIDSIPWIFFLNLNWNYYVVIACNIWICSDFIAELCGIPYKILNCFTI